VSQLRPPQTCASATFSIDERAFGVPYETAERKLDFAPML
jgi:hypothetical protein